ncbi:MBL fold metallo-hydrolase [Mucilaginibacter myungsuensis]|uniref:MBL fold metallo-hydrolase n=1 Tax=Mucilaginibacter myungsuensis TaxID=649104 RepID=A0A929PX72_9SPHI|nr:MBL fold metallo-hydrolase [Mucilaginibacter myungsuensis]MBE9663558.1 MBL fold metallo-hydrolase [Mucilaginibacter myungsuensis]MDN3599118.1 MBL fold metallo-hydrolase [Mucilaginibacter myungsuensis]
MKKSTIIALFLSFNSLLSFAQLPATDKLQVKGGELTIQPITHATLVLSYQGKNIYIDPTGGAEAFKGLGAPDMILITDIHGDHFDPKTLEAVNTNKAVLIAPQAVADKLPATTDKTKLVILKNGETKKGTVDVTAIPMYNIPESPTAFHTKGRGNGYVLNIGGKNIYISGDTMDIPEMRSLKNIDVAFVCMNLPYTMDVKTAASGVLAFKPKIVYPYHYRGQDVEQFKSLVNAGDKNIDVRLREWYPVKK